MQDIGREPVQRVPRIRLFRPAEVSKFGGVYAGEADVDLDKRYTPVSFSSRDPLLLPAAAYMTNIWSSHAHIRFDLSAFLASPVPSSSPGTTPTRPAVPRACGTGGSYLHHQHSSPSRTGSFSSRSRVRCWLLGGCAADTSGRSRTRTRWCPLAGPWGRWCVGPYSATSR